MGAVRLLPEPAAPQEHEMVDIFKNPTSSVPKGDKQIVRVNMEEQELGGRKSHLPSGDKSDKLPISHVKSGD